MRRALPLLLPALIGCATEYPMRTPTQERFPSVAGEALDGARVRLPEDLAGAPAVLLVAYEQDAQFDVDRWILGLVQLGVDVRILEVPTIPGLVPGLVAEQIDEGMKGGIPQADWGLVVTLYDDEAKVVAAFTGNADRRNVTRVIGLDAAGVVRFFADEGYSASAVRALAAAVTSSTAR